MGHSELYKVGCHNYHSHNHIVLDVMKRYWMLTSCSQVSGQMSFRDMTNRFGDVDTDRAKNIIDNGSWGITSTGFLHEGVRTLSQKDFIEKGVQAIKLLKLRELKSPFIAVENAMPFITDGKTGISIHWPVGRHYRSDIVIFPMESTKCYKVIEDPCVLDDNGALLTPLAKVLARIEENFEQFADPFAVKQRGTKNRVEAVTISPGKRNQARKRTRVTKS